MKRFFLGTLVSSAGVSGSETGKLPLPPAVKLLTFYPSCPAMVPTIDGLLPLASPVPGFTPGEGSEDC